MIMVIGAFGVLRVGGALVDVWNIGWNFGDFEHCRCPNSHLEVVSLAFNVCNAQIHI